MKIEFEKFLYKFVEKFYYRAESGYKLNDFFPFNIIFLQIDEFFLSFSYSEEKTLFIFHNIVIIVKNEEKILTYFVLILPPLSLVLHILHKNRCKFLFIIWMNCVQFENIRGKFTITLLTCMWQIFLNRKNIFED